VPALLPPHRKATNSRLPAMATLCFGCGTRRVSQCAVALPMKFTLKVEEVISPMSGKSDLPDASRYFVQVHVPKSLLPALPAHDECHALTILLCRRLWR
jgi:hypothetical protein